MVHAVSGTPELERLFSGWQETIIWSCLQGVMGELYADSAGEARSAVAVLGDFRFFAGIPSRELISFRPGRRERELTIMAASTPGWFPLIEAVYGNRARRTLRYAIKKEKDVFNPEKLKSYAQTLPDGFTLHMIGRELFWRCANQDWSRDFVSQYADYEQYQGLGLGVAAVRDGEIVSGASSYSSYRGGIEIEIDTKEEFRRMGLATACGARLILECLERGLYPSWDAHNRRSVCLADMLGYHFDHAYTVYEVSHF